MLGNIGFPELLVVLVLALIFFGPGRLPEVGKAIGKGIRQFKDAMSGGDEESPRKSGR
jgi:sec-independent protein translocase protein TatA